MPNIPAISGVLNNCSIGAALPSIIEKIGNLAALEGDDAFDAQVNLAEYMRIKNNFCKFYDIDEDNFSFQQFHNFLQQQSFFSKQMILGPVLREYMADNLRQMDGYDPEPVRSIVQNDTAEAQNIGRFPGLTPVEANQFLYKPLGIEAKFFDLPENASEYIAVTQGIDAPPPEASEFKISVYHKGGHYELQPHDSVPRQDNSQERFFDFSTQCGMGSGNATSQAIAQLKIDVKVACLAMEASIDSKIDHLARNVHPEKQAEYKDMIKELVRNHETLLKPNNTASRNEDEELAKKLQEEELRGAGMISRK